MWNVSERMQFETKLYAQLPQDNIVQPHAGVGKSYMQKWYIVNSVTA